MGVVINGLRIAKDVWKGEPMCLMKLKKNSFKEDSNNEL